MWRPTLVTALWRSYNWIMACVRWSSSSRQHGTGCLFCLRGWKRTNQGHFRRRHLQPSPTRPPAICGLVWAAVLMRPLAARGGAPPALLNYQWDGVSPPPTPPAEPLCHTVSGAERTCGAHLSVSVWEDKINNKMAAATGRIFPLAEWIFLCTVVPLTVFLGRHSTIITFYSTIIKNCISAWL